MLQIHSQSEKVDEKLYMFMKKSHHLLTIHLLTGGHTDLTVYVHPVSIQITPVQKEFVIFFTIHHLSKNEGNIFM